MRLKYLNAPYYRLIILTNWSEILVAKYGGEIWGPISLGKIGVLFLVVECLNYLKGKIKIRLITNNNYNK
jgi:hypothetical protein